MEMKRMYARVLAEMYVEVRADKEEVLNKMETNQERIEAKTDACLEKTDS
jgi:hypothetical protein